MNQAVPSGALLAALWLTLVACGETDSATGGGAAGGGATSGGAGGASCSGDGKPELTGPITGLQASYLAGDPIDIAVPVDADTARVIVGIYEVGSTLYLGGTAEEASGASTTNLSLFAGVKDGEVGTFYLEIELCSTSVCTTPFVRNTYDRVDRAAPMLAAGETYQQKRENVGGPADVELCPSDIPIQSFEIH